MRRLPWSLLALGFALGVVVMILTVRNGSLSEEGGFISVAFVSMYGWAIVGAILSSRNPTNPIGWLMIAFGLGFVLTGFADEWATYAYRTDPGGLPFRGAAAWFSNWGFLLVLVPLVLVLLLYPSGTVASSRWRPLLWSVLAASALAIAATMLKPGVVDIGGGLRVMNPTGVEALAGPIDVIQRIVGIGYTIVLAPLCVVALIVRYRRASGEEQQQIRWLAYVAAIAGVAFVVAVVSGIGIDAGDTSIVNEGAFWVFFVAMGVGFPVAIGIALLRYRLWDLDVVVKKTVVATVVVGLITVLSVLALVGLSRIVVGPISDEPALALGAGLVIGALLWPLLRLSRRIADRVVYGGRATPYEVLTEFSDRMAESYATDDVLPRMASILAAGAGAERVRVWLLVGRELLPAATWPAGDAATEPAPITELAGRGAGTFEVRHQGELLGAIQVRMPANDPMDPSKEKLIRDLASQAGLVLRNVRLIEELRASRRRLVAAQDEERRRLERNIHDGAQQQLVALSVKLRLADQLVGRDPPKAHEILVQLQGETTDTLENLRDLARGIYPPLLADQGLTAAIESQIRKSPVPVDFSPDGVARYDEEIEAAVYFCCLESLQNVAKYARASRVSLRLRSAGDELRFEVTDDGVGFDPERVSRGLGLQGMADRLEAIGGRLTIRSAPGEGTTVLGVAPTTAS